MQKFADNKTLCGAHVDIEHRLHTTPVTQAVRTSCTHALRVLNPRVIPAMYIPPGVIAAVPVTRLHMEWAAKYGEVDMLKTLHEHLCPTGDMWREAVYAGQIAVLEWALETGLTETWSTVTDAAWAGQLDVLKWACTHGFTWNDNTIAHAAFQGHLKVVEWLHTNGCPWDIATTQYASENGHLDLVKYAVEHGCPWNVHRENIRCPRVMQWLRTRPEWDEKVKEDKSLFGTF